MRLRKRMMKLSDKFDWTEEFGKRLTDKYVSTLVEEKLTPLFSEFSNRWRNLDSAVTYNAENAEQAVEMFFSDFNEENINGRLLAEYVTIKNPFKAYEDEIEGIIGLDIEKTNIGLESAKQNLMDAVKSNDGRSNPYTEVPLEEVLSWEADNSNIDLENYKMNSEQMVMYPSNYKLRFTCFYENYYDGTYDIIAEIRKA